MQQQFNENVTVLHLFPGISPNMVDCILNIEGLQGLVLATYGSGNAPTNDWFIDKLKQALAKGLIILNVSQCTGGRVMQGRYQTSKLLEEIGVVSGSDLTIEAAVTKLMFLLGNEQSPEVVKDRLKIPICGEMS